MAWRDIYVRVYSSREVAVAAFDDHLEGVIEFINSPITKNKVSYCYLPFMYNHNKKVEEWQLFFHTVELGIA